MRLRFAIIVALLCIACQGQAGSGFSASGVGFNNGSVVNINFPYANQTSQAQNNVAGCNLNVPVTLCQGGSGANTTASGSIAFGTVTINLVTPMSTAFPVNSDVCLSGATTLTQLNGLILVVNSATTTSKVVGTLVNTQNAVQTPANIGTTTETNLYMQGPGWQPCYLAHFPAPNTYGCGPAGNGSPTCSATGTPVAVNSWVIGDWAIANPTGTAPHMPMVLLTDLNTKSGHTVVMSHNGESNDLSVSLNNNFTMTDPPNWSCGMMGSIFSVKPDGSGTFWWQMHHQTNLNNRTAENFEVGDEICGWAPDDAFEICPEDMFAGFPGNNGMGTSTDAGAPFVPLVAVTPQTTGNN